MLQTIKNLGHEIIAVCSRSLANKSLEGAWTKSIFFMTNILG